MKDFTFMDISLDPLYVPNWFANLGLDSREEGIEHVLKFMKKDQPRFDSLGLRWDEEKRRKKKGGK